jgi:hypothetical protein
VSCELRGFVGHEWEVDRCPCCASVLGMVNVASYLRRVILGPGAGSTRVVPFRHICSLSGSATPDPELGAAGFDRGWVLSGLMHPPLPTDERAPVTRGLSLARSLTGGSRDRGSFTRQDGKLWVGPYLCIILPFLLFKVGA